MKHLFYCITKAPEKMHLAKDKCDGWEPFNASLYPWAVIGQLSSGGKGSRIG
jgi:hypothetical protein